MKPSKRTCSQIALRALSLFLILGMALTMTACRTETPEGTIPLSEELTEALEEYLENILMDYDLPVRYFSDVIEDVQKGTQAVYVTFDPTEYYYACAYALEPHEDEALDYCCVREYVWVGYAREGELQEKIGAYTIVAAFQINKTLPGYDLVTQEEVGAKIEHYLLYKPEFRDGYNVAPPLMYHISEVHLIPPDTTVMYCSDRLGYHGLYIHPYVIGGYIGCEVYLSVCSHVVNADGQESASQLEMQLGSFYSVLMEKTPSVWHSKTNASENTEYCRLFRLDEVMEIVSDGEKAFGQ